MKQPTCKAISTWNFTQNSWAVYKAAKLCTTLKNVNVNGRRVRCLFNNGHKNLGGGYTEFKLRPDGDLDYWAICAYCGGRGKLLRMDREIFDRAIHQWPDWLEVK